MPIHVIHCGDHILFFALQVISVTFRSDAPKTMTEHEIPCKITKITFDKPVHEVTDWDDRLRTVKWVDLSAPAASVTEG